MPPTVQVKRFLFALPRGGLERGVPRMDAGVGVLIVVRVDALIESNQFVSRVNDDCVGVDSFLHVLMSFPIQCHL